MRHTVPAFGVVVNVRVSVAFLAMFVGMKMQLSAANHLSQNIQPKQGQHQAYAEFEPTLRTLADLKIK